MQTDHESDQRRGWCPEQFLIMPCPEPRSTGVEYRLCHAAEPLIARVEALSLTAYKVLGCRDAGRVDLRCDGEGRPHFLEINPLAGIHPVHSDLPILCSLLKVPYVSLIGRIVASAMERVH